MEYLKDIILAICFLFYPFVLLMFSKRIEASGVRGDTSRKFVHIAMGIVIFFIPYFDHLWIALIPPAIFVLVNLADYHWSIFSQIQGEERGNVGTILYPLSYFVLIAIFYKSPYWSLAVLGILTMALGDAGASIIGRAFGQTKYYVNDEPRSYLGSSAMFIITFIVCMVIFAVTGAQMGIEMSGRALLSTSFLVAGIATIIEALSIKGSDNFTVPVFTAIAAYVLITVFAPNVLGSQAIVNQPLY